MLFGHLSPGVLIYTGMGLYESVTHAHVNIVPGCGRSVSRTYYTTELSCSDDGPSELGGSIGSISANNSGSSASSSTGLASSINTHSPDSEDEHEHDDEDENNTKAPASRSAHLVHPGDNPATLPLLSLNKSLLRCYH